MGLNIDYTTSSLTADNPLLTKLNRQNNPALFRKAMGVATIVGLAGLAISIVSLLSENTALMRWLRLLMVVVLLGMPVVVVCIAAIRTLGERRTESYELLLLTNLSGRQIAEGYNARLRHDLRIPLLISLALIPTWAITESSRYISMWPVQMGDFNHITPHFTALMLWTLVSTIGIISLWLTNLLAIAIGVRQGLRGKDSAPIWALIYLLAFCLPIYGLIFFPIAISQLLISTANQEWPVIDFPKFLVPEMILMLLPLYGIIENLIRKTGRVIKR